MYNVSAHEATQLYTYLPTSFHDWLLIDLWSKMQANGDLDKTMLGGSRSLLAFCKVLADPETSFAYDQDGPYFVAWCEPVMCGIALGFWVRADKRQSRQCLKLAHTLLERLFTRYPTIVVITKDPDVSKFHAHFGFLFACEIPHLYDGEPAYISFLTRERYQEKYGGQAPQAHDTPPPPPEPEPVSPATHPLASFLAYVTGGKSWLEG